MPGIELNWPNKNRVLYEVPQRGQGKPVYYGDLSTPSWPDHRPLLRRSTHGAPDPDPNRLIKGDNLVGLQALLDEGMGRRFKCICIDPPYNTGSAFIHYDDGYENTIWLGMMRDRIKLLSKLLSADGSLWIFIDDNQSHYLKAVCDEIFGRYNFISSICWQKIHSVKNDARLISVNHDNVLVYAKNIDIIKLNLLTRTDKMDARYANPDNDTRGPWQSGDLVANEARVNGNYFVTGPTGKQFTVPAHKHWVYSQTNLEAMIADNRIWFGKKADAFPRKKRFLTEVQQGRTPDTWWTSEEVGHNQEAKREVSVFNEKAIFATPKPERLLHRVIELSTNEGDWVLDSFAGSGTTAAVAYQMNRRWVTIEQGDHAETHCLPRLEKVRLGTGPYKAAAQGGFVFEEVGPPLVIHDETLGIERMNPQYVNGTYQRAVCLLTGFKHQPSDPVLHGRATVDGGRFCHVAERGVLVTDEYLDSIRQTLASLAHANGQDMATCIVYATKITTNGGDGVEVVRIPGGFTSISKNGKH